MSSLFVTPGESGGHYLDYRFRGNDDPDLVVRKRST